MADNDIETMTFEDLQDLAAEYGLTAVRIEGGRPAGLTPGEARTPGVPRQTETEYAISEIEGSDTDIKTVMDFLKQHVEKNNIRQQPVDARIEKLKGDLERDKEALAALESNPRAAGPYAEYENQKDNLTNRIRRNETSLKDYGEVWERTNVQKRKEQQEAQQARQENESAVYRDNLIQDARKWIGSLTQAQEKSIAEIADIISKGDRDDPLYKTLSRTAIGRKVAGDDALLTWAKSIPKFEEVIQDYYGLETTQRGLRSTVRGLEDELSELTVPGMNTPPDLLSRIRNELRQAKNQLRAPVPQVQVEPWTAAADLPEMTPEQEAVAEQAIRAYIKGATTTLRMEDITNDQVQKVFTIIGEQYRKTEPDYTSGSQWLAFIHAVLDTESSDISPELRAKVTEYQAAEIMKADKGVMDGFDSGFNAEFATDMGMLPALNMDMVRAGIISGYKDRGAWPPETTDDLDAFIRTDMRKIYSQAMDNATSGGVVDGLIFMDEIQRLISERTEKVSQTGLMNAVREWKANEYRATLTGRGRFDAETGTTGKVGRETRTTTDNLNDMAYANYQKAVSDALLRGEDVDHNTLAAKAMSDATGAYAGGPMPSGESPLTPEEIQQLVDLGVPQNALTGSAGATFGKLLIQQQAKAKQEEEIAERAKQANIESFIRDEEAATGQDVSPLEAESILYPPTPPGEAALEAEPQPGDPGFVIPRGSSEEFERYVQARMKAGESEEDARARMITPSSREQMIQDYMATHRRELDGERIITEEEALRPFQRWDEEEERYVPTERPDSESDASWNRRRDEAMATVTQISPTQQKTIQTQEELRAEAEAQIPERDPDEEEAEPDVVLATPPPPPGVAGTKVRTRRAIT
jgi:hypothetical protein